MKELSSGNWAFIAVSGQLSAVSGQAQSSRAAIAAELSWALGIVVERSRRTGVSPVPAPKHTLARIRFTHKN
ncbi:MAG: hypothetical protein F6J93_16290 [Oscillatoria sp. SIO1A7]|nr:hypothetical protein [Oscillatoria sp. SIO1A7]